MKFLCVIPVRNEGPFLLEWLAHALGAGITDFLFFSNDCEDGTDAILDVLAAQGLLTHIRIKATPGQSIQWHALKTAWKHPIRKSADWMMTLDADEMLNIHTPGHTLADLVNAIPPETHAITLPWRLFGNNGQVFASDTRVRETFTKSAPADCDYPVSASFFKTMFRPDGPFNQLGIHRPQQKKNQMPNWVDGSGKPLHQAVSCNPKRLSLYGTNTGRDLVELNHYSIRSAESFMVKRARGLPNRSAKNIDLAYWVDRNFNTVQNTSIQQMAFAQHHKSLLDIPGISALHQQAVLWHHQKFQHLMRSEAEHQLFSQILVSGDSAPVSHKIATKLVHMYQTIDR